MIRKAQQSDIDAAATLAAKVFTSVTADMLKEEFEALITDNDAVIFLYYINNISIGFAQCQLRRDYVEGTQTSPVGYLEGIFVEKEYRKLGYGRMLVQACENWAQSKGCTEFVSDCEWHNTGCLAFHLNLGFHEANRIICFTKQI